MKAHNEDEVRLRFRDRPAWVSSLADDETGAIDGAVFKWLDGPHACSPEQHYTDDYGYSFVEMTSYIGEDFGMVKQRGPVVTDPEKVETLKDLWITYQRDRGWPVFCP
jgi:hypothetical protein